MYSNRLGACRAGVWGCVGREVAGLVGDAGRHQAHQTTGRAFDDGPFMKADRPWEAAVGNDGTIFEDRRREPVLLPRPHGRAWRRRLGMQDARLGRSRPTSRTGLSPPSGPSRSTGRSRRDIVYGLNVARGRSVDSACVFKENTEGPNDRYKLLYREPKDGVPHLLTNAMSRDELHRETLDELLMAN